MITRFVQQITLSYTSPFQTASGASIFSLVPSAILWVMLGLVVVAFLAAILSPKSGRHGKGGFPAAGVLVLLFLFGGLLLYIWTQAKSGNYLPFVILAALTGAAVWFLRGKIAAIPARRPHEDEAQYKGRIGEALVQAALKGLDPKMFVARHNLIVPGGRGTTEIDSVVFSYFGVFVIETKNWGGSIYGREADIKWTVVYPDGSKEKPLNPLHQNRLHVNALRAITALPPEAFHSIAVVSGGNKFPKGMPDNVIRPNQLRRRILAERDVIFSGEQFDEVMLKVDAAADKSPDARERHVASIRARR